MQKNFWKVIKSLQKGICLYGNSHSDSVVVGLESGIGVGTVAEARAMIGYKDRHVNVITNVKESRFVEFKEYPGNNVPLSLLILEPVRNTPRN